ncbi:hypothetical protein SANTM175S_04926 [Streptomyces antimycoticus]
MGERPGAVGGLVHGESGPAEVPGDDLGHGRIVVHDEHAGGRRGLLHAPQRDTRSGARVRQGGRGPGDVRLFRKNLKPGMSLSPS